METLYTSQQIADMTARGQRAVQSLARKHGIGRKVGRDWLFTQADLDAIAAINPLGGRPNKTGVQQYKADPATVKKGRPKKAPPAPSPVA